MEVQQELSASTSLLVVLTAAAVLGACGGQESRISTETQPSLAHLEEKIRSAVETDECALLPHMRPEGQARFLTDAICIKRWHAEYLSRTRPERCADLTFRMDNRLLEFRILPDALVRAVAESRFMSGVDLQGAFRAVTELLATYGSVPEPLSERDRPQVDRIGEARVLRLGGAVYGLTLERGAWLIEYP